MSNLSREEELRLIADAEAARDDPDAEWRPVDMRVEQDAPAVLTLTLPMGTLGRFQRAAEARECSLPELLDHALDALGDTSPSASFGRDRL